jgi:hypothetical protein
MQAAGDVHEMYEKSLSVEPREREDEKLTRWAMHLPFQSRTFVRRAPALGRVKLIWWIPQSFGRVRLYVAMAWNKLIPRSDDHIPPGETGGIFKYSGFCPGNPALIPSARGPQDPPQPRAAYNSPSNA